MGVDADSYYLTYSLTESVSSTNLFGFFSIVRLGYLSAAPAFFPLKQPKTLKKLLILLTVTSTFDD